MTTAHRPLTLWLVATLASANVHPGTDSDRRPVLVVVLHNYASIAPHILEHAAREVERAYAQLGVGVRWVAPPLDADQRDDSHDEALVATIHVRLFRRDARDRAVTGVLGIDAPHAMGSPVTVTHVLYEPVGDDSTSGIALAYVLAHLMGNIAMTPDVSRPATIVRAARGEVEQLQHGESPFTREQADRIRAGVRAAGR